MSSMDTTFSAAGQEGSVPVHPTLIKNMGNPQGDRVDKTEGNNLVNGSGTETKVEGSFGQSTVLNGIQYNANSFYPHS